VFVFDLRSPGPKTPEQILAPFLAEAAELDAHA
jgi:hypothetical protein